MGRQIRAQHEEAQRCEQAVASLLTAHSRSFRAAPRVLPAASLMTEPMKSWSPFWIRNPDDWVCRTRSRDRRRQRLDLVRHLFQAYPVPRFLENLWLDDGGGLAHPDAEGFTGWYVAAATGLSVYRECSSGVLSRRETHIFLAAPDGFSPSRNIWWARARAQGALLGTAGNIARSKLARGDPRDGFWTAAMRFFLRCPEVRLTEMEDLLDYLGAVHQERGEFPMRGRTLESVRRASEDWHRLQIKAKEHGAAAWPGSPIADWQMQTGSAERGNLATWRVTQIRTGKDLVSEGHAQHHCVAAYKSRCLSGASSIWSMTRESGAWASAGPKRALTIEADGSGRLVQARGYANREPTPDEARILAAWMWDRGIRKGW
jgi:hypothetical protein